MKKRIVILIAFVLISFTNVFAQNITFTFTGKNSSNQTSMAVDKVYIVNETNGTDTTIYSNTFTTVKTAIDITELDKNKIINSYPNPFSKEVTISFNSNYNGRAQVAVYTIEGKLIAEWTGNIGFGESKFLIKSNVEGLLFLSINSNNIQLRTKLICMEKSNSSEISSLTYNSDITKSGLILNSGFSFSLGDRLKFVGYSGLITSEEIIDTPAGNKSYSFVFDVSDYIPMVNFVAQKTKINQGESVNFSDLSTKTPTNWSWDFGDGGTSNIQNPSHTYWIPGTFAVSLTAENNYGSGVETKSNYITVNSLKPKAEFIAFITEINKDESISFFDQSTNSPTSWKWDFGDGGTSTIQNPTHQFNSSGFFTIKLIAKNSFGSDTIVKTDYIKVIAEEPTLSVTPTILAYGTSTTQNTFDINNSGTGTLTWTITEGIDWLQLNTLSGSTTSETDQITATVNRTGLAPGIYPGTISIISSGGNQDINVSMEVSQTATVEGYIYYSATTIPISGVTVQIGEGQYTTGESGHYILEGITLGNHQITATKNNYDNYSILISVIEGINNFNIDMTSDAFTHNVYGTVKDNFDNPLFNVKVTVLNPDNSISELTTNTDVTGYYQLPSVPQGSRTITFEKELHYKFRATIFISNSDYPYNTVLNKSFGEFIDKRDSTKYNWVGIGDQIWMVENLAYLPSVSTYSPGSYTDPYYYVNGYQGSDVAAAKATDNFKSYGVLYNWPAAMAGNASSSANPSKVQGVCPAGWHLPSDAEWTQLENYLADNEYNYDGTIGGGSSKIAKSLAATTNWNSHSDAGAIGNNLSANNKSGFSAFPGGYRYYYGGPFFGLGTSGFWWSCTGEHSDYAEYRSLSYWRADVNKDLFYGNKSYGFSVRCVRD